VISRGQIWWSDFGVPRGASPRYERPAVVIQSNIFNRTNIRSVIVAVVTTNLRLADMPGNVFVEMGVGGLREDSVINISQLFTLDRADMLEYLGELPEGKIKLVEEGLRLVLALPSRESNN